MKKFNISLAVVATLAVCSTVNAQSLSEALKDGKVSGEVTATFENRNFDKDSGTYSQDTSYSMGSFALKYETAVWNNISFTSKIRAYKILFEEDDELKTWKGKGDASERFYEDGKNRTIDAEELFLSYTPNANITVTVGRQNISTDWINKTHDALKVDAVYGDTSVEAIWSTRQGRVTSRDYRPMTKMNDNDGVYKLGVTHQFDDTIAATGYALVMPDIKDIYGARANLTFGDTLIRTHYAVSDDKSDSKNDSSLIDLMASSKIAGFTPYIGYIKVDSDASFPGYNQGSGEILVPFEEGDYVYSKDAETLYAGLTKSFGELSTTLLYGTTKYDVGADSLRIHETTLWMGYSIMKELNVNLGYTIVDEDSKSTVSDYDQVNVTIAYSF